MENDWTIIKDWVRMRGSEERSVDFLCIEAEPVARRNRGICGGMPFQAVATELTREQAAAAIRKAGLVLVGRTADGKFYDTLGHDFINTYKGRIYIPDML